MHPHNETGFTSILRTPDLDSETARLVALGALIVRQFDLPQIRYATMTDPEGNTFDVVQQ